MKKIYKTLESVKNWFNSLPTQLQLVLFVILVTYTASSFIEWSVMPYNWHYALRIAFVVINIAFAAIVLEKSTKK